MKTLSVIQPWAWAIIHAGKTVENRTWECAYRGELAIHASKEYDLQGREWIEQEFRIAVPGPSDCPRGGVIGMVQMVDCVTRHSSPWFFGPFGFVLAEPQSIRPIPTRGQLGIFEVDLSAVTGDLFGP